MKNRLFRHMIEFALLNIFLFTMFQAFAVPVLAKGSFVKEEIWEGHIWKKHPQVSKTLKAPVEAKSVEILADWQWSGSPVQKQTNEKHEIRLPIGQVIKCDDYGDEELAGQWVHCGSVVFEWGEDLDIDVVFTGDNSSTGSHHFRVIVRWYGEPDAVQPTGDANCVGGSVTNPNSFPIDVVYTVDGELKFAGQVPAKATKDVNYIYKDLGVHRAEFSWSGYGYTGRVDLGAFGPCAGDPDEPTGTASCRGGSVINPNPFPIDVVYTVDGDAKFAGQIPANVTKEISFNYSDQGTHKAKFSWSSNGQSGDVDLNTFGPCNIDVEINSCSMQTYKIDKRTIQIDKLGAVDNSGNEIPIKFWKAEGNAILSMASTPSNPLTTADQPTSPDQLPVTVNFPDQAGKTYWVQFMVNSGENWVGGQSCLLEYEELEEERCPACGQYQDFIGAVPFGTFTPYLEPGKEYFDGTRSLMLNVEYITGAGQGDIVFRFNGQEISDVTTSIFYADTFRQVNSLDGRAKITLNEGVTKMITYRFGVEQARIFQTVTSGDTRWIHPLDQPFEHKYEFELEIHGPANTTDLLIYGDKHSEIRYNENGIAIVELTYNKAGLVAIYKTVNETHDLEWITVDSISYPIETLSTVQYDFSEAGLYHYRLVDGNGQIIAGPSLIPHIEFKAKPGMTYSAQLIYPATSIFVGLYDDMKFKHPDYWTMPIDAHSEHDFEFHLDYHRQADPNLDNDHIRGNVVVDALYLTNGTTSVAQQFPYGRHDGSLPGVTIVGIPNVSMVAFCQRPGVHEVVYWGGWENESYYLPDRGWIFDEEMYEEWTDDQRGDCIDVARQVNMELARQGLRTDHTYHHHGERSQGYQMAQLHIWSPYNLAGMRPPHLGQFLKPGTILTYYEDPEDMLFWGWDLDNGGLATGIGAVELQQHVASLGPVVYGDQTGLHPPEAWPVPQPPIITPPPVLPTLPATEPTTPEPTPEPSAPEIPVPEPPTPEPPLEPPVLEPAPPPSPST